MGQIYLLYPSYMDPFTKVNFLKTREYATYLLVLEMGIYLKVAESVSGLFYPFIGIEFRLNMRNPRRPIKQEI